jgi:hypothetical protein
MEPPTPVSELDRLNITLMCKVESGNPDILQAVRWYLDGELLKELPDCGGNATDYMFCDIDPSKLLLEDVGRSFHGNYSCEGMNEAGWGPLSPDEELIVYCKFKVYLISSVRITLTFISNASLHMCGPDGYALQQRAVQLLSSRVKV